MQKEVKTLLSMLPQKYLNYMKGFEKIFAYTIFSRSTYTLLMDEHKTSDPEQPIYKILEYFTPDYPIQDAVLLAMSRYFHEEIVLTVGSFHSRQTAPVGFQNLATVTSTAKTF